MKMAIKIICDLCRKETENKFKIPLPVFEYGSEHLNNHALQDIVLKKKYNKRDACL